MAAIDFPNSPTLNQIYTSGDKSWKWDGTVWNSVTKTIQGDPGRFYTSDTAPTFPTLGDGWFNTTNGKMYVFYDNFWVDAAQSIFTSNITDASTTASGLINTTTQTFAGNKTFTGTTTIGNNKFSRENTSNEGGQINLARASDDSSAWYLDVYGSTSTPSLRIVDASAAAVRMSIDESGRILKPYQPAFHAYGTDTGNQAIGSGGVIPFQNIRYNIGNHYNSSNYRFTAPVSGIYHIWFEAFNNSGATYRVALKVNGGSTIFLGQGQTAAGTNYGQSRSVKLSAGDYIQAIVGSGTATIYSAPDHTEFGGVLLS